MTKLTSTHRDTIQIAENKTKSDAGVTDSMAASMTNFTKSKHGDIEDKTFHVPPIKLRGSRQINKNKKHFLIDDSKLSPRVGKLQFSTDFKNLSKQVKEGYDTESQNTVG